METELYRKMQPFLGDEEKLLERMAGSLELWEECVRLFPREEMIEEMDAAVEKKDWNGLYAALHRLKGNLANFGFDGLAQMACDMLAAIKEKNIARSLEGYRVLRDGYLQLLEKMEEA